MKAINFTKEHFVKLQALLSDMLFKNEVILTKLGQPLNVVELLHTQTINTLHSIRFNLDKQIESIESQDTWSVSDYQVEKLKTLKRHREIVHLILGYKIHKAGLQEQEAKKEALKKQLELLKESQKTPEDKIKELETQLESLDTIEEF